MNTTDTTDYDHENVVAIIDLGLLELFATVSAEGLFDQLSDEGRERVFDYLRVAFAIGAIQAFEQGGA